MSFIDNPKIKNTIITKVPCSFAKPNKDGSYGLHYVSLLLGEGNQILYFSCECEDLQGEAVRVIQELGGGTCAEIPMAIRESLKKIKEGLSSNFPVPWGPGPIQEALRTVLHVNLNTHSVRQRARLYHTHVPVNRPTRAQVKQRGLQSAIDTLSEHLLHLSQIRRPETQRYTKPSVFDVLIKERDACDLRASYLLTPTDMPYKLLATRAFNGTWEVDKDTVLYWADRNPIFNLPQKDDSFCFFCKERFERMSKHIGGAKHQNKVLETVEFLCKATSTTGLRMLNNPKHRSVFLGK